MIQVKPNEIDYLAKAIDNNSSFYVCRYIDKRKKTDTYSYCLYIKIASTCETFIECCYKIIRKIVDCHINKLFKGKAFEETNRKPVYEIKISRGSEVLLNTIFQKLKKKKKHASLAIDWAKTKMYPTQDSISREFIPLPEHILEKKEEIYKELKLLNSR